MVHYDPVTQISLLCYPNSFGFVLRNKIYVILLYNKVIFYTEYEDFTNKSETIIVGLLLQELKLPLLKVAAPELVGGLSGQSEERIRELFEQAVALAPCVLFIDEVDAITPNRETAHREMERRIVAQLLSSLDG